MGTNQEAQGGAGAPPPGSAAPTMGQAGRFSGATWGDFEIGEVLGRGPHGTVYRARQISLDRPVAIKVLDVELPEGSGFRKRFLREAVAVAQITSPHVAQIHFASVRDGHPYVAMELVEGADLSARLAGGSRLGDATAFDLMLQATRGLAAAALLGIVHRDLKPANLLIGRDGVLRLCDFGQVGLAGEDAHAHGAADLRYASPERARGRPCDHRSDLHSLGIIFHEMLTGTLPVPGGADAPGRNRHPMRALNRNIHPDLEALVLSCLSARPEDRPASPEALLHALENLLLDGRVYGAGSWGRLRRRRLAVAAIAASVAVAVASTWAASRSAGPAAPDRGRGSVVSIAMIDKPAETRHVGTAAPADPRDRADQAASDCPGAGGNAPRPSVTEPVAATVPVPATAAITPRADGHAHADANAGTDVRSDAPAAAGTALAARPTGADVGGDAVEAEPPAPVGARVVAAADEAPAAAPDIAEPKPMPDPAPSLTMRAAERVARSEAPMPSLPSQREAGSRVSATSVETGAADPSRVRGPAIVMPVAVADEPSSETAVERPEQRSDELPSPGSPSGARTDRFGPYADITVLGHTLRFRYCPAGRFLMGSSDDQRPRGRDEDIHQVTLTHGFWLADCECSQALWTSVYGSSPSALQDLDLPVERVTWEAAQDFVSRLGRLVPGLRPRLPTETEWEYACRAGAAPDAAADDLAESAWYAKTSEAATHPLKELRPNAWGLYDMLGNVAEWCEDAYRPYPKPVVTDPPVARSGAHVIRGGSFRDSAADCRAARRDRGRPGYCGDRVGLRLALSSLPDARVPRSSGGLVSGSP